MSYEKLTKMPGGRPPLLVLGCPAAIVLMGDHAQHFIGCVARGELSVLYFGVIVTCMLLVTNSLCHEAAELFVMLQNGKHVRKFLDWFFRINK